MREIGATPENRRLTRIAAFAFAVITHAAVIFLFNEKYTEAPEYAIVSGESSVELTLVAAAPAPSTPEAEPVAEPVIEPEPVVEPPPPEVQPEPPPEPPPPLPIPEPPPPEAIIEPTPAPPPPKPSPKPQPPKREPKPSQRSKAAPVGDGSSAVPGNDTTSSQASTGGDRSKPGYLRNPHPAYPEDARRAKQEGVVRLHIRLDENGKVLSVSIVRSSGVASLDERALSTVRDRWSFKPARRGGINISSEVTVPIRFSLKK